jgi:3,4-dihydroxy-2-butanone 4-phosphate synthase
MTQSQQLADCYQDLFNHLAQEYDLRLTESELDEVVKISLATVQKINALADDSIGNVCREIGEMSDEEFELNCYVLTDMTKHTKQ